MREALELDVREKLAKAVAAGPVPCPGKPLVVALAIGRAPGILLAHGPQHIGVVDLEQVCPLLERGADGVAVLGIALEQLPEIGLARGEVRGGGRLRRRGQHAHELGHDARRPQGHEQARQFTIEVEIAGGKQRPQAACDSSLGLGRGFAEADDRELVGPREVDSAGDVEGLGVDPIEGGEHRRRGHWLSLVGHGDGGRDDGMRIGGRERLGLPELDRLVFERHAGGGADELIVIRQLREGPGDRRSRIVRALMEGFEVAPERSLGRAGRRAGVDRRRRLRAGVDDAIEFALAAAAADGEVEGAIAADRHVGERQRRARHELLFRARVGRARGLEVDGIHRAERPVADVEGLLVLRWELRAEAERHAHGRTRPDVHEGRQAVWERRLPLAGAAPPAEVAAARGVVDTGGPVPRRAEVPFHVGVVDEHLAVGVEGEVVRIAVAGGPDFPCLAVTVGADDIAAGCEDPHGMPVGIPHPGNDLVFVPVRGQPARRLCRQFDPALRRANAPHRLWFGDVLHLERRLRVVAADDEQPLPIGRQQDVVGAVLTAALKVTEFFDRVERVVGIRIGDAIQSAAGAAVAHDVERVECPEKPLGARERHGDLFDERLAGAVERRRGDPHEPFVSLITGDDASLGVGREHDPRPEFIARHDNEPLHPESGGHGERWRVCRPARCAGEHVAPRAFARLRDHPQCDGVWRRKRVEGAPRSIAFDHPHAAVWIGEHETAGESGETAGVGHDCHEFVVAVAEVPGDIHREGFFPGVTGRDLGAVDEQLHPVVAGGHEDGRRGAATERLRQPVFAPLVGPPDPRCQRWLAGRIRHRLGCGGEGHGLGPLFPAGIGGIRGAAGHGHDARKQGGDDDRRRAHGCLATGGGPGEPCTLYNAAPGARRERHSCPRAHSATHGPTGR